VNAAFNRNLLVRINRELGGTFAIEHFRHRALWNRPESRVEMHLVADSPQHVRIVRAEIDFEMSPGDPIWTESSYKYETSEVERMLNAAGFRLNAQWTDEGARFSLFLVDAV
jgi:L-histidine Nalpha-methyltransferase